MRSHTARRMNWKWESRKAGLSFRSLSNIANPPMGSRSSWLAMPCGENV